MTMTAPAPDTPIGVCDTFAIADIKGIYVRWHGGGYYETNIRGKIPSTKLLEWRKCGTRDEFRLKKEADIGVPLIVKNDRTTLVHQCIIEDALRYCGVYESTIDAIVPAQHRVIKQIVCGELHMNICLANDYFDLTALLAHMDKKFTSMRKIVSLVRFAAAAYEYEHNRPFAPEPGKDIWDHYMITDIDYDAHKWLPQIFLPPIAQWCSVHYAVLVSQIMMTYHRDPIFLARIAIAEFDRQSGLRTTAVFKSTADPAEHVADIARLEALVKEWRDKHEALADATARQMIIHRNAEYGAMALRDEFAPFSQYLSEGGTLNELKSKTSILTHRNRAAAAEAETATTRAAEAEAAATAATARIAALEAATTRAIEDNADIERQFAAMAEAIPAPSAAMIRDIARFKSYSVYGDSPRPLKEVKAAREIVRKIAAAAAPAPAPPAAFTIRAISKNDIYIYTSPAQFAAIRGRATNAQKMEMIYKGYITISDPPAPLLREFAAAAPGRTFTHDQLFIATPDPADAEAALCAFIGARARITHKYDLYGHPTAIREMLSDF